MRILAFLPFRARELHTASRNKQRAYEEPSTYVVRLFLQFHILFRCFAPWPSLGTLDLPEPLTPYIIPDVNTRHTAALVLG